MTRGTVASAASVGENEGNSESQKKDASNERHFGRWITRTKDGVVSRVSRARGRKEESCEPALPDAASLYTFRPIPSRRLAAERQGADTDPPLEASSFVPEEASVAVTRQRDELHSVGMSASHSCLSIRRPGGRARKGGSRRNPLTLIREKVRESSLIPLGISRTSHLSPPSNSRQLRPNPNQFSGTTLVNRGRKKRLPTRRGFVMPPRRAVCGEVDVPPRTTAEKSARHD